MRHPPAPEQWLSLELAGMGRRLASRRALLPEAADVLSLLLASLAPRADGVDGAGATSPREAGAAPTHALDRLVHAYALSPAERDLLLLAGMAEEHEEIAGVLRALHPSAEPKVTAGLAARLLCDSIEERALLRRALEVGRATEIGLLRVEPGPPFFERSLTLLDGLWSALRGVAAWPVGWTRLAGRTITAGLDVWLSGGAAREAVAALERRRAVTVLVTADRELDALERARALAHHAGCPAQALELGVGVEANREPISALDALATALDVVPILRLRHDEGAGLREAPSFDEWTGPVVLCARPDSFLLRGARATVPVPVAPLTPAEHASMWRALAPELASSADALGARYPVEPAIAAALVTDASECAAYAGRPLREADLASAARGRVGQASDAGVRHVVPKARWEHLALPPRQRGLFEEILQRVRGARQVLDAWGVLTGRPGARGVRVMMSGPPGTGKTLSAEALAHALGVDLLVVDVARIVSKWVGETEKNLSGAFDLAERTRAVLLFDEADALFGRRTAVLHAQDRYANLETAYLLSRLERFDGLAVLTTNLRDQIDRAFIRRMEFVVEFDPPDEAARAAIWRLHLPHSVPQDSSVSIEELARAYPVVGATIRNAAAAAAFTAAGEGGCVTQTRLKRALDREQEKQFGMRVDAASRCT